MVAALLDGITLVVAAVPSRLRFGDARRLVARARERSAVLVALGDWPVEAAVRVHTGPGGWRGLCLVSAVPLVFLPFLARVLPESGRWLARDEPALRFPPPAYRGRLLAMLVVVFLAMSYDIAGFSFATYVPIARYGTGAVATRSELALKAHSLPLPWDTHHPYLRSIAKYLRVANMCDGLIDSSTRR